MNKEGPSYKNPPDNWRSSKLHLHSHKNATGEGKESSAPHLRAHLHTLTRTHSHRHTKSDVPSRWTQITNTGSEVNLPGRNRSQTHLTAENPLVHPAVTAAKGGMLTRISTNLSGKNIGGSHPKPRHQYSASDFHKGKIPTGPNGRPDLRRRATSDTRPPLDSMQTGAAARYGVAPHLDGSIFPQQQQERRRPLTEIEKLLLRAEKLRRDQDANITDADVQKTAMQLAESRVDLQDQLARNTRTASSMMRRLDDAHDALVSTASSLIDTVNSFQNLCQQSETLIGNFSNRSDELDKGMRKLLAKHRKSLFDQRGEKISELEERGRSANKKAEEMSRRLENCRTVLRNYTEREQTKQRAWRGVIVGTITGVSIIVLGFLLGFGIWWYRNYGIVVRHDVHEAIALALDPKGLGGNAAAGHVDEMVKSRLKEQREEEERREMKVLENVPEEVRKVLEDIAVRHNDTGPEMGETKTEQYIAPQVTGDVEEEKRLKRLFEKLEL